MFAATVFRQCDLACSISSVVGAMLRHSGCYVGQESNISCAHRAPLPVDIPGACSNVQVDFISSYHSAERRAYHPCQVYRITLKFSEPVGWRQSQMTPRSGLPISP